MIAIRPMEAGTGRPVWCIIEPVFRAGEAYTYSPDISEQEAHKLG